VLFVALANVANLMMIRADARQHELAVREALGANRMRIATHFLGESVVLAAFAGAAALLSSWAAVRALVAFGPADLPRLSELAVGAPTVAFVIAVSVFGALVCTVVPTIRIRRATLFVGLREGGRGDTAGRVRQRLRATIAASQIAVAFVTLAGSALLLRTYQRLGQEQPGFDGTNVVTLWTQLPFARYDDSASVAFYAGLTESVSALPGVVAAGVSSRLPLDDEEIRYLSFSSDDGRAVTLPAVAADSGYFASMKIPVVAGHGFRPVGVQHGGEIVMSRRAVQFFLGDTAVTAAVGRRVSLATTGPAYTVVGVVGDVRDRDLGTAPSPTIYMAQAVPIDGATEPRARRTMALVVRTHGPATGVVAPIRKVVRDLDPAVPIFNIETMSDIVRASTARLSFTLALMGAAAVITLALGAIGLYGVMTYMVALRTREFGIRIAIGADPQQLARSVALGGTKLLAGGIAGGLILYAAATPFLRAFLYGVTAADPMTLVGATAILVSTALLASWLPARRASNVDPTVALRAD
jgi:predicted permease